jgi:hypothetical protein
MNWIIVFFSPHPCHSYFTALRPCTRSEGLSFDPAVTPDTGVKNKSKSLVSSSDINVLAVSGYNCTSSGIRDNTIRDQVKALIPI